MSVYAEKAACPPLVKDRRTQTSGAPKSLQTPTLHILPTPLHSQMTPVFASVRTEY